jgi:hypothetical protein
VTHEPEGLTAHVFFSLLQVRYLLETVASLTVPERRLFLRFCTGAARLPIGGFGALSPPLTVVSGVVGRALVGEWRVSIV